MSFALLNPNLPVTQAAGRTVPDHKAMSIAWDLVREGIEFHFEPMPDGWTRFTVKREHETTFDKIIEGGRD